MNDLIFFPDDCHLPTFCGCYLRKLMFLPVLLGHIADGITIDFIFHHDTNVTLLVVDFIFTAAQLRWIDTLFL